MRASDTLTFELSDEQELVLGQVSVGAAVADDVPLESSYRAWNAHFVAPSTPPELSASTR